MEKLKFKAGLRYSRQDIYEMLKVPADKRRGNWETGYNKYGDNLFIFCNVGSAGRSGHNYDNRWLDENQFQWFAKERTHVGQRQIQWMLNPSGDVLLFTRADNREPFTFNGYAKAIEHEAVTPVRFVWQLSPEPLAVAPANLILANRAEIEHRNYVRIAKTRYWFGFDRSRINSYKAKFGSNFALILVGESDIEGDYFAIPYSAMSHLLVDEYATHHSGGRVRWIGDVQQNRLRVSNCLTKLDVGQYYGIPLCDNDPKEVEGIENDYAIENRRAEVKQRVKQSLFRRRVLHNFDAKCCLSGITEPELLVASHIVPWASRVDSRLDPANGLCLSVMFDALFDHGLFSLTDDMHVIVTQGVHSEPLRSLLASISGKAITVPRVALKLEYLMYHRQQVFKS